jgi:hypothetical protein
MKVIKKGRSKKNWAIEHICTGKGNNDGGCGATLLVELTDLFHTHMSFMSLIGRNEEYFPTFECPICNVLTDIHHSIDIPRRIKDLPTYREFIEK